MVELFPTINPVLSLKKYIEFRFLDVPEIILFQYVTPSTTFLIWPFSPQAYPTIGVGNLTQNNLFEFEVEGPFFIQKYSTGQIYTCLMELPVNSYRQIKPPTDGSKTEQVSKCIRISVGDIDQIVNNDLISKYLITKLKNKLEG